MQLFLDRHELYDEQSLEVVENMISFPFLSQGGPIMWVLLLISITALAIILLKAFQSAGLRSPSEASYDNWIESLRLRGHVDPSDLSSIRSYKDPKSKILLRAIELLEKPLTREQRHQELSQFGSDQIRRLESFLRSLAAIGYLSPLIGLLGTVTGMIEAFMAIQSVGSQVEPSLLAGGIWEALLTTAFGLIIAIPSVAAYYIFESWIDQIASDMKRIVTHTESAFMEFQAKPDREDVNQNIKNQKAFA